MAANQFPVTCGEVARCRAYLYKDIFSCEYVWRGNKKKPLLHLKSVSTSWPRIVRGQTAKAAIPKSTTGKWDAVYSRSAFIMTCVSLSVGYRRSASLLLLSMTGFVASRCLLSQEACASWPKHCGCPELCATSSLSPCRNPNKLQMLSESCTPRGGKLA